MNTMPQIIQAKEIPRPAITPLKSSVLDHFAAVTNPSFGLRNDEGLFPSYNMIIPELPIPVDDFCADSYVPTFAGPDWITGSTFAVQLGSECKAVGLDKPDMESEVRRVFEENAGAGVEQWLLLHRFNTPDADVSAPTSVTGLPAVQVALAMLAGYAAVHYAGQPTYHMPRAAAELLGVRLDWKDGNAFTKSGARVVCGGGYDLSESDGTWDLYVTGELYIEKSEDIDVSVYVLPGSTLSAHGMDNTVQTLVERMYRVGVDGRIGKATAKVW